METTTSTSGASTKTGPDLTVTIDGDSVTVDGTSRGDDVATTALKDHGFRWSRTLGAWFLPRTWRADTKRRRVREFAAAMQQHGRDVEVSDTGTDLDADTIHAGRRERAAERAEHHHDRAETAEQRAAAHEAERRRITGSIPLGQPILLGHHSQARHERDLARAAAADRKDREETERAKHHQAAAQRAELAAGEEENPVTTKLRIERLGTERREITRALDGYGPSADLHETPRRAEGEHRADLLARAEELDELIRYHRARLAQAIEAGRTVAWGREHFRPGDGVRIQGQWRRVVRVNRVSVSVTTGYSWTDTVPYAKITARRRDGVSTTNPDAPGPDNPGPNAPDIAATV